MGPAYGRTNVAEIEAPGRNKAQLIVGIDFVRVGFFTLTSSSDSQLCCG
jgi:hypothetical protein